MKLKDCLSFILTFSLTMPCFVACQRQQPLCHAPNLAEARQLKTGDLVFCVGQSLKSDLVRTASQSDAVYSHVGFVVCRNGNGPQMVHMSADADAIMCESFEDYILTSRSTALSFYRIPSLKDTVRLHTILDSLIAGKTPFDRQFDFKDSGKLYCTELVIKAVDAVGCDVFRNVSLEGFVCPDDLLNVSGLECLYAVKN